MTTLSPQQIAALAANAGYPQSQIPTITAIVLAESGGNPNAINYNDPGGSFGLTQINARAHGYDYARAALDPQTALNESFDISHGGNNFSPWSTFKSGAYLNFLSPDAPASASINPGITITEVNPAGPWPADVPIDAFGSLGSSDIPQTFGSSDTESSAQSSGTDAGPLLWGIPLPQMPQHMTDKMGDYAPGKKYGSPGGGMLGGVTTSWIDQAISFLTGAGSTVALAIVAFLLLVIALWPQTKYIATQAIKSAPVE